MSLRKDSRPVRRGHAPQRWACRGTTGDRKLCYSTVNPDAPLRDFAGRDKKQPIFKRARGKTEIFVVTCAQNGTPRHKGFYAALEQYCEHRSAQLLVIPTRYKNPTSSWTESQENADTWDVPKAHLLNTRFKILPGKIEVLGDIKTQPTATDPLSGFEAITAGESGILGHTKLQLRTVAAPQGRLPKLLTTTGACTVPNYTDSKAGKLGEFHHTLGAAVVEARDGTFHLRQINATKDGTFQDLEKYYTSSISKPGEGWRPLSLTHGDTHVKAVDPVVDRVTEEIVKALRPKHRVWHDLVDGASFNPHSTGNPFVPIALQASDSASVRQEVMDSFEYLAERTYGDMTSIIVPSNHHDFLQRWVNDNDWRRLDAANRIFYLETALALAQKAASCEPESLNAYIHWAKQRFASAKNVRVLEYDESCMLGEIEHGLHGHKGPNGARGSLKNLRRIGVKTNTGHSHSPGIDEGAYRAGTSTRLRLGYNTGPSSWLNSHILTYATSKRTLINIINGEWRL